MRQSAFARWVCCQGKEVGRDEHGQQPWSLTVLKGGHLLGWDARVTHRYRTPPPEWNRPYRFEQNEAIDTEYSLEERSFGGVICAVRRGCVPAIVSHPSGTKAYENAGLALQDMGLRLSWGLTIGPIRSHDT